MMSVPRVRGAAERMDEPDANPVELAQGLADLRAVNRWLGGTRVVLSQLGGLMRRHPRPRYRVLDVATGSADIPLAVAAWARRRGVEVEVVASDVHAATLKEARQRVRGSPEIAVEQADALGLPYEDGAFDFALLCTALHHFEEEDAVKVLRELGRVTRIGVVVSDLRRSRAALLGARLLAVTAWRRHPMTRHDGPLSVRRSFTPREMRAMAARAGLTGVRVLAGSPIRVALVAERPPVG